MASLEDDVARLSRTGKAAEDKRIIALPGQDQDPDSDQEEDEEAKNLDPSRFVTDDAAYFDDDVDGDDDLVDLGIAMGRMRITERIGGLVRPRIAEEVIISLSTDLTLLKSISSVDPNTPSTASERSPTITLCSRARSTRLACTKPRLCCPFVELSLWSRHRKDVGNDVSAFKIHGRQIPKPLLGCCACHRKDGTSTFL